MRCDLENTEESDCADPRIQKGMTTVESDTKSCQRKITPLAEILKSDWMKYPVQKYIILKEIWS